MTNNALRDLALKVHELDRRVRAKGSTSQLANSSIESGAIRAYEGNSQTMQIGRQWDGTYAPTVVNGPIPPTPSTPGVVDGIGGFVATWDGQFEAAAIVPMDFLRVDVHVGVSDDFIPSHDNRFGSISAPTGGSLTVGADAGTYYVKLVCWTLAGKVSLSTVGVIAHSNAAEVGSDGSAPTSSPTPEVLSGIESLYVRWTPIVNADTVTYEIYISDTTGFTPGPDNKSGETLGSFFTIKALPGDAPADPSAGDPRQFDYDTVYYIKIIARDDDGAAPTSAEATGNVIQIPAGSLAANVVTAREVVAGSFTGDEFAGSVAIFSDFKTSETGQRLWWGISGIQQFRSDNTRRFYVPPTDEEDIFIDAQVRARGLQVTGGASFEGTQNSIEKDGALRLASGVSSSSINTPQASVYYDSIRFNMPSGAAPTGALGTFALNPTEVNAIAWTPASKIKVYHYRPNQGTRIWQFDPTTGNYESHIDFADYEIMGEAWDPANPADGYMLFRWMPDGSGGKAGLQYYVAHANVFNKYSRADGTRFPSIGWVGSNFFVAEDLAASGKLQIRQYSPTLGASGGNLPAPLSTFQTAATLSYLAIRPQVLYGSFAGGVGGNRFAVSENGGAANAYMFDASGTWLMDDQFEAPGTTKRGFLYDGSNFRTYGNDGNLYKHTTFTWTAATTSKLWLELTLRDAVGTTHETTPGPVGSITMKRRSNVRVTFPPLPFAGTGNPDDPDRWVVYAGRGSTVPANAAMWKQSEAVDGVTQTVYTSLATSGTNPPTSNNFPGATPGELRNDALSLRIKGDGSIQGATIVAPVIKVGADLATGLPAATDGPYWLGYLSSQPSIPGTSGTTAILAGWTALESDSITLSAGTFTIPKAGLYRVLGQLWWAANTGSSGTRLTQARRTGAVATTLASVTLDAKASGAPALAQFDKSFRFAAGDTFVVQFNWVGAAGAGGTAGAGDNRVPTATSQDISFLQLIWDRA